MLCLSLNDLVTLNFFINMVKTRAREHKEK